MTKIYFLILFLFATYQTDAFCKLFLEDLAGVEELAIILARWQKFEGPAGENLESWKASLKQEVKEAWLALAAGYHNPKTRLQIDTLAAVILSDYTQPGSYAPGSGVLEYGEKDQILTIDLVVEKFKAKERALISMFGNLFSAPIMGGIQRINLQKDPAKIKDLLVNFKIGVTEGFVLWLVFNANYKEIISTENSDIAQGYTNINNSAKKYFELDLFENIPNYHDGLSGKTIIQKYPACKTLNSITAQ